MIAVPSRLPISYVQPLSSLRQKVTGKTKGITQVRVRYFLFAVLFEVLFCVRAEGQTLPGAGLGLPGISAGLPSAGNLSQLGTKPEIPYLEELRQIQSLKRSYDSLREELARVRKSAGDSLRQDSLLSLAKDRSREVLDREVQTLESLIAGDDIPGEGIRNAAGRTLDIVRSSGEELSGIGDLAGLESLVDQNGENLKALTNEWLMPGVEEVLTGKVGEMEPGKMRYPDFYGKDALEQLTREGVPADLSLEQAKSMTKEKALHLSNEYLAELKGKYSKIRFDSLGNVEVVREVAKKREFRLLEENELKGASFLERFGAYVWYDPLTSFGEGFYGDAGVGYRFSQQLESFAGAVVRRHFSEGKELSRVGQGAKLGVRLSKGKWFLQSEAAVSEVVVDYPSGFDEQDYKGESWSVGLGIGRAIPMGKRIQSVVLATWDPIYKDAKGLSNSPFQLKIGFELKGLKGMKSALSEGVEKAGVKERIRPVGNESGTNVYH